MKVAAYAAVDDKRHAGPDPKNVLRQIRRGERQQVVSTYRPAHDGPERSRAVSRQIGGERVHVHAEGEGEVRERGLQPQGGQGETRAVHAEGSAEPLHRQSALLPEGGGGDAHTHLRGAEEERVGIEPQLTQGNVVRVEAGGRGKGWLLVIAEPSAVPMDLGDGVEALEQIHVDLPHTAFVHQQRHGDGIARCAKGKGGVVDSYVVEVDLPEVLRLCRVFLCRVSELHEEISVVEQRTVHAHVLLGEVDAVRLELQLADLAADAHVADEVGGVDLHVAQGELVDHDLLVEQRPELHVGHGTRDERHGVGLGFEGIVGLKGAHVFQREVEGKGEAHMAHADRHARLLRGHGRGFCHCPVLKRREIEQQRQNDE